MNFRQKISTMLVILILAAALAACAAPGSPALDLKGTKWQVIEINGKPVSDNIDVTADFGDGGQVSGSAACNNYFADYTQDGGKLAFGPAGMTEMWCMEEERMETEAAFGLALAAVQRFEEVDGQLRLKDASGVVILVFGAPKAAPSLAGSEWRVVSVGNLPVAEGLEVTMRFEDGKVNGKSACNNYFADFTQEGSSLKFGMAGSTMMYCDGEGVMAMEAALQGGLEKVRSFTLEMDALTLLDESGAVVIVLGK